MVSSPRRIAGTRDGCGYGRRMRTTRARRASAALVLAALAFLTGCGAAGVSIDDPSPTALAPTPPPVVVPADGVSLAMLGLTRGPVDRVYVPRSVLVSARVDQDNNVTLVLTSPSATDLAAYLRRTLPANGFTLTADDAASATLTFAGFGWIGTFTGSPRASALLLRPAG